ncbi:DUF4836 family protein [Chitinophaga sp. 30R24]|uniref:DUF4836 family protein n=1 Tax=Chitinophaga sp. 30R24 TaxID=3248838 RepID=UPI003B8EEE21
MKRTISKVLLAAVSMAVILSSCSKTPDQSRYVPKTASIVIDLNAKQLTTKLVTNGITMDKLFNAAEKDTANEVMKAWKDAENSGIDLQSHFFAAVVLQGQPSEKKSYVSITGHLKDADKFEAYLKKTVTDFSQQTQNDFKYIWDNREQAVIGWTKSTVIYLHPMDLSNLDRLNPGGSGFPAPGGSDPNTPADSIMPVALLTKEDDAKTWVAEVDHLFHLKKEETATTIEPFAKLLKKDADAGVFVNADAVLNSGTLPLVPANVKKLLEGTSYTSTINFENGKVIFDGDTYMGKEVAAIYKKYGKKEINMDMLKQYPSENVVGFISYAFDFHLIGELIKATGMDGLVNIMITGRSGLSMDDILNAFDGELTFVASDFTIEKQEYMPGEFTQKPSLKWIFNMKVGNKDAIDKVMSSPMFKEVFTKQGDRYIIVNPMAAAILPPLSVTDKFVTLGSDSLLLQQYLAGKGNIKLPNGVESKVKGTMLGGYIDLEKMTANIPEEGVDTDQVKILHDVKQLFKDFIITSKADGGDIQHSEAVLTFKNKDQNSLVQLINFSAAAAKMVKEKQAKTKAYEDSLFGVPVDTAVAPQ